MSSFLSRWSAFARPMLVVSIVLGLMLVDRPAARSADGAQRRDQAVTRAIDYLRTKGQAEDGSFSAQAGPAVTALVVAGVLRNGRTVDDPLVAKGLKYLEGFVQPDGGVYKPGGSYRNYETCVSIVCFSAANADHRYDKILEDAEKFIKAEQWGESRGHDAASPYYGGAGYGKSERPDLSNTSFLMDALQAAGNGPDDEAVKRALIFVSRCQNLESADNTTAFAAKIDDGGFYYTPAGGGSNPAGKTDDGGLRSYGSMTYAGLKSMIYAGVGPDDPRVKAAVEWIQRHYSLDENPGMGDAGLFYYYHTFAKALDALGQNTFVGGDGTKHDWRQELSDALAQRQHEDGSWTNQNGRWLEGDPNLVTGYALLTLAYCRPPQP